MKKKLLIVEDEPVLASTVAVLLDPGIYSIRRAPDGIQALRLMAREVPDVILSDLVMPGMDGLQLLEWARENGYGGAFVMMTVKTTAFRPMTRARMRPDAYLGKPFDRSSLVRALETGMAKASSAKNQGGRRPRNISVKNWSSDHEQPERLP